MEKSRSRTPKIQRKKSQSGGDKEKLTLTKPLAQGKPDMDTSTTNTEVSEDAGVKISDEALAQQDEIEMSAEMASSSQPKDKPVEDYGIEFDDAEITYKSPERNDALPDLYRLIASLEEGTTNPDTELDAPSLFARPEHVPNYQRISELRIQLEEEEIPPYIYDFDSHVQDDVLMVGNISLEEIQEEERRLRDEHIAYQEQEAAVARQRQQGIVVKEEEAKKRVAKELKEKRKFLQRRLELLQQHERLLMDKLNKAFRRAENQLKSTLERRKGEIKTMYGDLTVSEGVYGGSKGRRWRVDWDCTPQPIQVKLKTLRGVKDKLPDGRYILMVSLYNRLGGKVMKWSKLRGQRWGGTTLPAHHNGHFYNTEIKLDQSVFTALPSRPDVRPGMVLVFELFLLRGATVPTDRVVGWGCFPIADGTFNIVEGRFKTPLLRGEADDRITKHGMIEELMSTELDHWLCNLYFEVVKLPRYLQGQKEYEVELQFSSGLVNYPDRINTGGEEYRDGEYPLAGSDPDLGTEDNVEANVVDEDRIYALEALATGSNNSPDRLTIGSSNNESHISTKKQTLPIDATESEKRALISPAASVNDLVRPPSATPSTTKVARRPFSALTSGVIHRNKKVKLDGDSDSDDYEEEDVVLTREEGFFPVRGKPGIYYKKYRTNNLEEYHKKLYTLLPKTPLLTRIKRRKKLSYLDELETHAFSVNDDTSDKGRPSSASSTKMEYVGRQLFAELGLSQWRSREFWAMIFLFVLCFFMRMYLHYVSQWLFLQGASIPINRFDFAPYTVHLNYQPSLLTVAEETLIVLMGVFGNIIVFAFFVFLCWIIQKIFGYFPDVGCKFVLLLGVNAFLDPFFIAIADTALQRWSDLGGDSPIADYTKIYWNYHRSEGSGLAGIFITVFLYVFTCFASGAILYMYFLRLHNNGRMLDIYWRLFGEEDMFFVPFDLEVSNQELAYLVKKAEQWRGEEGERRKIAVYDFIWEEDVDEEEENESESNRKSEVTTHVSIHTLHLDGLKELHRHFLRMPDGAIVEVFGDMTVPGVDKDVTNAVAERAKTPDQNSVSQTSLNQVRERSQDGSKGNIELKSEDEISASSSVGSSNEKLKQI